MPTGNRYRGPAAVVAGLKEFTTAFPDWRVDVERVISRAGCAVAEVERGRIVRYRDYDDRASLYAQLELMDLFNP